MASSPSLFNPAEFSPAAPHPLVIKPEDRIARLNELLKQDMLERQRINILKLIQLYKKKKRELEPPTIGQEIWLCDGEVMSHEPTDQEIAKHTVWLEACSSVYF